MPLFRPLLPLLVLAAFLGAPLSADTLAGMVDFKPAVGWSSTPTDRPSPFPTVRYAPDGKRNAAVLITLFPAEKGKITDFPSLRDFHLVSCRPYLPKPEAMPARTEFKLPDGFGIYAVFTDPERVGKPSRSGEYKLAVPISVLLGKRALIHATILCDDTTGADYSEAWKLIRSLVLTQTSGAESPAPTSSASSAKSVFQAPPGFTDVTPDAGSASNYFMYAGPDGIVLSVWLEPASKFKGMRSFWTTEKATLEEKLGARFEDETTKIVAGWNVVTYTMPLGSAQSQNLRACRVYGDTWVDVHLSQTLPKPDPRTLEALVPQLKMVTPATPASPK